MLSISPFKTIFFLFAFIVMAEPALAQVFSNAATIKEGPVLEQRRAGVIGLIGSDNDNFYIKKYVKGDVAISKLGKNLVESNTIRFDNIKYGDATQRPENFIMANGKIFLVSTCVDRKNKNNIFLVTKLNAETLLPEGESKKLAEIGYESKRNIGGFNYVLSRDQSKILIFSDNPDKTAEQESYSLKVFDSNMNLLWEKEDKLPYNAGFFNAEQYYVNNAGDAYIIGTEFMERTVSKRSGKPTYKYHILAYYDDGRQMKDYELALENKFITDLRFDILPSGEMVTAGFYSEQGRFTAAGTFYMSIDPITRKAKNTSVKGFSFDFVTETFNTRQKKRANKRAQKGLEAELTDYVIREMLVKPDGGIVILAEQYYYYVTSYYNPQTRMYSYTYHYFYNDVVAVSVDNSGNIEWNTRVRKYQHTTNDGGYYSSFVSAVVKDKIYLIFNDSPKNMATGVDLNKTLWPLGRGRDIAAAIVEINQQGEQKREILFSQSKWKSIIMRPKICAQYDNDKLLLMGEKRKKYQYFDVFFTN
jgi:hypothetical protein